MQIQWKVDCQIIIPMLKNQTVNIKQNEFILSKIKASPQQCLFAVSFEPFQRPNLLFESIVPHFNRDRHYFTPAFVLPKDEKFYRENINFEKLKFEERIQNAREKNITQNNYKLVPASDYCQLCRLNFKDYLEHTESQQHCNQIAASQANLYIEELASRFLPFPQQSHKIVKSRRNGRAKALPKKSSHNVPVVADIKMRVTDSKNSNQSTHLMSSSY